MSTPSNSGTPSRRAVSPISDAFRWAIHGSHRWNSASVPWKSAGRRASASKVTNEFEKHRLRPDHQIEAGVFLHGLRVRGRNTAGKPALACPYRSAFRCRSSLESGRSAARAPWRCRPSADARRAARQPTRPRPAATASRRQGAARPLRHCDGAGVSCSVELPRHCNGGGSRQRQHPRQRRGHQHHHEAHAVRPGQIAHLNQPDPVVLRVAQAGHRHPAQQPAAGEFQAGPDDRRRQDHGDAEPMHGHPRQAHEHRQIEGEVERERDPADARGRIGAAAASARRPSRRQSPPGPAPRTVGTRRRARRSVSAHGVCGLHWQRISHTQGTGATHANGHRSNGGIAAQSRPAPRRAIFQVLRAKVNAQRGENGPERSPILPWAKAHTKPRNQFSAQPISRSDLSASTRMNTTFWGVPVSEWGHRPRCRPERRPHRAGTAAILRPAAGQQDHRCHKDRAGQDQR